MFFDYVKIILISLALSNLGVTQGLARLLADGTLSSAATTVKVTNGKGLVEALRNLQPEAASSLIIEVVSAQVKRGLSPPTFSRTFLLCSSKHDHVFWSLN